MKIAYLISEDLSSHPGLKYKIEQQILQWRSLGHEVFEVRLLKGNILDKKGEALYSRQPPNFSRLGRMAKLKKLAWMYDFASNALKWLRPDITYSRYLFPALNVRTIHSYAGKLIFEVNSDDRSEYMQKSMVTGCYNAFFRGKSLEKSDALVFVTKELSYLKSFNAYASRKAVVANGVNVEDFEFVEKTGNQSPQLVFIGSPGQAWHGLDKVKLLAEYLSHCSIHIVGPDKPECERLWGQVPENVIFHGYLPGAASRELVSRMDVGIGTLGLHRNKMNEACPLKVRQYLSHGLPIIAASKDTDISADQSFYLQLPNIQDNVAGNLDIIRRFIDDVFENSTLRKEARKFAEEHLSVEKKEADRIRFFEQVCAS